MTTVLEALAGVARRAVAEFVTADGALNGRVRGGHVVHAVRLERWLGEVEVPAPACHIGIGGWDFSALIPTDTPVTCARCLHAGARSDISAPGAEQLTLWPDSP